MSVPHGGPWSVSEASAAAQLPDADGLLETLAREQVLRRVSASFEFAHEELREALYGELDEGRRAQIHGHVAEVVLRESTDVDGQLSACAHFIRAGKLRRAYPLLKAALRFYANGDMTALGAHARRLEEIYLLLRAAGQDDHALAGPLALLAVAGYFVDRRYADRYGELAIAAMQSVVRLPLLHRLRPVVGRACALGVALLVALVGVTFHRARSVSLRQTVHLLLAAVTALSGTAAVCLDPERAARYAKLIEPFTIFGRNHGATIAHDFAVMLSLMGLGRPVESLAAIRRLRSRLETPRPIRDLPGAVQRNYRAACILLAGIQECWSDSADALGTAEALESFSPLYAMGADQIRALYYAGRGDLAQSQHWQRRLDVHALQVGSAWQIETWAPAVSLAVAVHSHDATLMKRALQELERLQLELPSVAVQAHFARGGYLALRGKYSEAVAHLESREGEPFSAMGWLSARGALAFAYNEVGQHALAHRVCVQTLAVASAEVLALVVVSLRVQVELARAEAGLGRLEVAHQQLDRLLSRHAPQRNPLTLGMLHEAKARVALRGRDFALARLHASELSTLFRGLAVPGAALRARALARLIEHGDDPRAVLEGELLPLGASGHMLTRVQLMLHQHDGEPLGMRASKGLQVALELSNADEGFIVLADSAGKPAAHLGSAQPGPALMLWAEQSLLDARTDERTLPSGEPQSQLASNSQTVGNVRYCMAPLWVRQDGQESIVAGLVLGFHNRVPNMPAPAVLRAIAGYLAGVRPFRPPRGH